jgi:hypothetical protein
MSEVERSKIDEVCNEDDLPGPKVSANPEHDEGEHEQVVLEPQSDAAITHWVQERLTKMKWLPTFAALFR